MVEEDVVDLKALTQLMANKDSQLRERIKSQNKKTDTHKETAIKKKEVVEKGKPAEVQKKTKKKNTGAKASKPSSSEAAPEQEQRTLTHTFEADQADHAETPLIAYKDIVPILKTLAKRLNKPIDKLLIYDPYYCDGGVKKRLAELGFPNVYNENKDFYQEINNDTFPDYDILVTNPPYSGDHVDRLATFCRAMEKPALLLLPKYCYMNKYFASEWKKDEWGTNIPSGHLDNVMFLCPEQRYVYEPPRAAQVKDAQGRIRKCKNKSQNTSPFVTMWYLLNIKSKRAVYYPDMPNECRSKDPLDPYREWGQKKAELSDGRKLCKQCGQVEGNCKHTNAKIVNKKKKSDKAVAAAGSHLV